MKLPSQSAKFDCRFDVLSVLVSLSWSTVFNPAFLSSTLKPNGSWRSTYNRLSAYWLPLGKPIATEKPLELRTTITITNICFYKILHNYRTPEECRNDLGFQYSGL